MKSGLNYLPRWVLGRTSIYTEWAQSVAEKVLYLERVRSTQAHLDNYDQCFFGGS